MQRLEFGLGLIEGYYGRSWNEADRRDCLEFIAGIGYRYYIYAPKGDTCLRRNWGARWSGDYEQQIRGLSALCDKRGMRFGVGLSPLGLAENPDAENRQRLRDKVRYLDGLGTQMVCILFDDMPRCVDNLAELQCELVNEILAVTTARHVLVCPSYYSTDPILERLFGRMPRGYWEVLGRGLPAEVGLFWTGKQVCSHSYDEQSLRPIAEAFGRLPALWDNYPVNDGAKASKFLHIDAFRGRPAALAQLTAAHFVNPMNQSWLSRIPLATLPCSYREGTAYRPGRAFKNAARHVCGRKLAKMLEEDLDLLQKKGLDVLSAEQRDRLRTRYAGQQSPCARELLDWLDGRFAFDPACLTD